MKKYIIKIEINKDKNVEFYNVFGDLKKANHVYKIGGGNIADQAFYRSSDENNESILLVYKGTLTEYGRRELGKNNIIVNYNSN
jgi:hypothetical protein